MEYTLFQDFAHKIPRLEPPTGRPDRGQSGRTPEFGYGPLAKFSNLAYISLKIGYILSSAVTFEHYDITVMSYLRCWYLFWYVWKEETRSNILWN